MRSWVRGTTAARPAVSGGGGHARLLSRSASSSTRSPRESRSRHSGESGVPSRLPACQRRWRSSSASRSASTSSDGDDDAGARVAHELARRRRRVGRRRGSGRSAARYSKIFPVRTPRPRPPDSGISSSSASESRCSSSERRRETSPSSSMRSPRPSDSAYSRSAARKSPAKRADDVVEAGLRERRRNGFGSRLPWKWPACVIRRRSLGWCSRPAKSSKSQPLRDRHDLALRLERAHLLGDRVGRRRRSRRPATRRASRRRRRSSPSAARAATRSRADADAR